MKIQFSPPSENSIVLDEMFITDPVDIHIERMSDTHIWLGIGKGDELVHLDFSVTSDGHLLLRCEDYEKFEEQR